MTTHRIGHWLLVTLALVGLALTASVVSAHGTDVTATDAPPYGGSATDWADWMESHMTDHMGQGALEWMESHMGTSVDEMGDRMADSGHGPGMYGRARGC